MTSESRARRLSPAAAERLTGFVGRVAAVKGVGALVRALRAPTAGGRRVHLLVVASSVGLILASEALPLIRLRDACR